MNRILALLITAFSLASFSVSADQPAWAGQNTPSMYNVNLLAFTIFGSDEEVQEEEEVVEPVVEEVPVAEVDETQGFFVVTQSYYPEIPGDLPEDSKPSQYLMDTDIDDLNFIKTEDVTVMFLPYSHPLGFNGPDYFTEGFRIAVPIHMSINSTEPGPMENLQLDGALLLEVVDTFSTRAEMEEKYGVKAEDEIMFLNADTEKFEISTSDEDGTFTLSGGPAEEGWSDEMMELNRQFYIDFYVAFGCFIATEIYGSWQAEELAPLREFRDKILLESDAGRHLVAYYYRNGPGWAVELRDHPYTKAGLIPVFTTTSWILDKIDLDNPTVQAVFTWGIEMTEWMLSPWLEEEAEETEATHPIDPLKLD